MLKVFIEKIKIQNIVNSLKQKNTSLNSIKIVDVPEKINNLLITDNSFLDLFKDDDGTQYFPKNENLIKAPNLGENFSFADHKNVYYGSFFQGCSRLKDLSNCVNWDVENIAKTNYVSKLFSGCSSLTSFQLNYIKDWNMSHFTSFSEIFKSCSNLADVTLLSNWDTSKVADFSYSFANCSSLMYWELNWNTSRATNFFQMFQDCRKLEQVKIGSDLEENSRAINFAYMFKGCSILEIVDLSGIKTTTAPSTINSMFQNCPMLSYVDISGLTCSGMTGNYSNVFDKTCGATVMVKNTTEKAWWESNYPSSTYPGLNFRVKTN